MVMGDPQSLVTMAFSTTLRLEMASRGYPLYVAAMLPIKYWLISPEDEEQLAPDVLAARVPERRRGSYSLAEEGVPPAFVLEVVSPASRHRDLVVKRERYEMLGIEEYALFSPPTPDGRLLLRPPLQGYKRDPVTETFVAWQTDESGRLWSAVLELWLVARGEELRLQRQDGSWVLTLEEAEAARQQLEAEVARLRAELGQRSQD